ncbi:CxC2 domain-containing protein [Mycena chlorophos]|uniref:CxC2 domain-containing protein n=1 Tax=Mycena chlorophos TaxID=658473 RepID=A0A8H6SW16_MYCCL|nr:CxC2 domain-containing protein [Mycena chlorophos]
MPTFASKTGSVRTNASTHRSGRGFLYFVKHTPYKEHLKRYVEEHDVSTCIAFAALMQKETRLTTGLRVSGVGGCVCARHGVVLPQGLGDLQKGERYANMDWVFLSAVGGTTVKRLVISYDIACQWKLKLAQRVQKITSPAITTRLEDYRIQFGLPVWHAAAHEVNCREALSLSHAVGVGRTDGEGIERTWAILNPISFSTKEMGEGNRQDTIEDKVDYINWEKNVGQGDTLARKMIIAIKERDRQCAGVDEVDSASRHPLRADWKRRVDVWNADKTQTLPYLLDGKHAGVTEAQILAELKQAEVDELRGDVEGVRGQDDDGGVYQGGFATRRSPTTHRDRGQVDFDTDGREVQSAHRVAERLLQKAADLGDTPRSVHARNGAVAGAGGGGTRRGSAAPPLAENVKLWLPSRLTAAELSAVCPRALVVTELRLREGQCGDAISKLRGYLHSKTHLVDHRNANAVGQALSTRYGNLINRVTAHIDREFNKLRPEFKPLTEDDLKVYIESESDAWARAALGTGPISWIWFVGGEGDQKELHDSVRVQWTKALARRDRWTEEVAMLREEMKRVLRSVDGEVRDWENRLELRTGVDAELATGLRAYALRQAAVCRAIGAAFRSRWSTSAAEGVRSVVNGGVDDDEDGEEEQEAIQ